MSFLDSCICVIVRIRIIEKSWRYLERNSDVLFNKKGFLAIVFPTAPILQLTGVF